jgi:DNA-binding MurR/RpiR family transcriptional regulator
MFPAAPSQERRDPVVTSVLARLRSQKFRQTKSDIRIANYLERNLVDLPFETAKSIAARVEVSPMTVGRYLRRLGYDGLDELKHELRRGSQNPAWEVKGGVEPLQRDVREGKLLASLVKQQIGDLERIYDLTTSANWQAAIKALIGAREVYVAAYQNVRGVAQYFASQLSYARPAVQFVDGVNGTYAEVLDQAASGRCLFLMDVRRFASKARPLGIEARKAGVKVILVTDEFCTWSEEASDIAIILPGARGPLWDGAAMMVAVFDLLISNIIVVLGDKVSRRVDELTRLQDIFGDFENE